jgi:hypothetical protein
MLPSIMRVGHRMLAFATHKVHARAWCSISASSVLLFVCWMRAGHQSILAHPAAQFEKWKEDGTNF